MLDGWEMQVKSTEANTNSHSLWVAISNWDRPGCTESTSNSCLMEPGGYVWINWLGGFELQKKYEVHEMNLSGFDMPGNPLCDGCKGRWALDPSLNSLKDDTYDIDNDTLPNGAESPTNWNTTQSTMILMVTNYRMVGKCNTRTKQSTTISLIMRPSMHTALVVSWTLRWQTVTLTESMMEMKTRSGWSQPYRSD